MTLRLATCLAFLSLAPLAFAESALPLTNQDVVVFTGGAEIVHLQRTGHLEALLTHQYKESRPKFRDLAWDADTVFFQGTVDGQWRENGHFDDLKAFGDWNTQLKRVKATVVIAQFGAMESLAGRDGLDEFIKAYDDLLDEFARVTQRVILVSPALFEASLQSQAPDLSKRNADLKLYARAISQLASERDYLYVDLTKARFPKRSENGWQTTPEQMSRVQLTIAVQLGLGTEIMPDLEPLRHAIVEKNRLWTDYWRPANWKCLFGDDGKRGFSKASDGLPSFQEEWATFPHLIAKAETQVMALALGEPEATHWAPVRPKARTGSPDADIAAETAAITVPEGFSINLFADESLGMVNPLGMRWDPMGRLYVACTNVYPQIEPGAMPDDFIVILEDTDGDGQADKSTRFAEGLNIPTGIELGHHGVYVGQNTEVLFLQDTDGDLRADQRSVPLSGFGNGDSHQTINAFVWSPGGELFFSQGDGIESRVETPWGVSGLYGPGAFRFSPQRMQLHGMLNNFMGPGNPWGIAFDDWGQAFIIDGAGGISHLTPAFLPVRRKLKLPQIGKPGGYCGIDVLASDRFPESMRNDFVVGDYKKNQVTRFSTMPEGAGFGIQFEAPLIKSSHRNFRPVDVRVGPDAGVYVADFYNPIICHQDDFYRVRTRDKTHGRIWRMVPTGTRFTTPKLDGSSIADLLERLKSKDRWTRYQAKRLLSLEDREDAAMAVQDWAKKLSDQHGFTKLEALRVLETLEFPIQDGLLTALLDHDQAQIRSYATRVVGRWADRLDDPLAFLQPRLTDSDARVRMEAVLACGMVQQPETIKALVTVTDLPMDRWIEYAFKQAVEHLKPFWLDPFERGDLLFDDPNHLAAVLDGSPGKSQIERERALILNDTLDLSDRRKRVVSLIAQGDSKDIAYAFRPEFVKIVLPEVAQMTRTGILDRNHPKQSADRLRSLLGHADSSVQLAAIELTGLWKARSLTESIVALTKNASLSTESHHAAIAALGALDDEASNAYLKQLGGAPHPPSTRAQAIAALCRHELGDAANLAATLLSESDLLDHKMMLGAFLKTADGTKVLDEALSNVAVPANSALRAIEALVALGSNEPALRARFDAAAGLTGSLPEYSVETIASLAKAVAEQGDPRRGEEVFRQATMNCYACHQIHGAGGMIGPDLTAIGNAVPIERLIEEVVWPQRQVKEGYNLVQITHDNGDVISGYLDKSEDEDLLLIRDPSTHAVRQLDHGDIEEKQALGSAMPAGLVATINRDQLCDLLSFLKHLGTSTEETTEEDARIIRAWEITLDGQDWFPFQSRVSGELCADDLRLYANEGAVTLRAFDGSAIEGANAKQLTLELDELTPGFRALRELK